MDSNFDINRAIEYMKDNAIVTSGNNDYFSLVDNNVHYKFSGSSVSLSLKDFIKLFSSCTFNVVEDTSFKVDDLKDKEYYERYKK